MALSQTDIDLLFDTGKFVTEAKKGKELSSDDQKTLSAGFKLFFYLADNLPPLSGYQGYDTYYQKNGLSEFIRFVNPSAFGVAAEEVAKVIAEEKRQARIKYLHQILVSYLQRHYAADHEFDWSDVSSNPQKDFQELAYLEGLPNDFAAYLLIRQEAGLPPTDEKQKGISEPEDQATEKVIEEEKEEVELPEEIKEELVINNNQVIAANLAKYLEDKETLESQVEQKFKDRTEKDRALIKRLVEIAALRRQTEILIANANSTTRDSIDNLHHAVDPQDKNLAQINQVSQEIVRQALGQSSLSLTRSEELAAVALITTAALAGIVDLSNSASLNEVVQAAIPKLNTPVSQAYQEIEANLILTPIPRYDDTNHPQIFPNISLDIAQISLPTVSIETSVVVTLSAPEVDRTEIATATAKKYSQAVLLNESTDSVMAVLNGNFTSDQETELSAALIADNLVSRIAPTTNGARAATVIDKLSPVNPFVTGAVVRLASQGLQSSTLQQKIASNPTSKTAQFFQKNPRLLVHTITDLNKLEDTAHFDLGKEIKAPAPGGFGRGIQSFTNRVSGLLPRKVGQIFNAAIHPIQFVQSKIGNFIGKQVVEKFKIWLAEKVVSRIANEALKKAAGFILKKGLQEGVKLLAKEGLKRGLQAIAQLANIAPGAGLLIAAAIEVGSWVLEKTFGLAKNAINGFSRALTGEDFDGKALITAPLIALAGLGSILGSLAAATAVAVSSAAIVIMGSTLVGFFLYITVITVAPIITTIAHLESNLGPASGGTVEDFVPNSGIICDSTLPPENNTSTNAVARKAYEIVSDLNKGFWGYCNNHPRYPELFNKPLFIQDPNPSYPGPIQNSASNLFWCTWLTTKAYGFAPGNSFMADGQMEGVNFQDIAGLSYTAVQPGDIIFINVNKSSRVANHVGVVYAVTEDAIVYLQSNAATKTANVPVRANGTIQSEIGRIAIIGFGRP